MSLVIPNVGEEIALDKYLNDENLTLKLFSNNIVPGEGDTAASYTEVAGGGYASKTLVAGSWTITPGDPSFGLYLIQIFGFTGPTNAPGTIYGYFVVDASNVLRWAERLPAANVPFTPIAGSSIRITPRFECS
jgi:hypothetical protein